MKNARLVILAVATASTATAANHVTAAEAAIAERASLLLQPAPAPAAPASQPELSSTKLRFLDKGKWTLTLGGGAAPDFEDASDVNGFAQVSYFLVKNFEIGFELGGWYFSQPVKNTGGVSGSLTFKYHFYSTEDRRFTAFADLGIGVLGAFNQVPSGGTNVNFLPRAGAGITYALTDEARLVTGLRWHHISNAHIRGDGRNPSRNGLMFYAGITFDLN